MRIVAIIGWLVTPKLGVFPAGVRTVAAQGPAANEKTRTAPSPPQPKLPVTIEQALYLIRSTLLTLNDANRTGNYTVFRDLAGPDFQVKNNPADLAQIFTDLRQRKFDLFAVALLTPQLAAVPALQPDGMLRLVGTFPTRPKQINFDLSFQNSGGQWRLYGISVQTPDATVSPPVAAQ